MSVDNVMEDIAVALLSRDYDGWAPIFMPLGSARQRSWTAEDGWEIVYTTERVEGGPWAGKFAVLTYKPVGPGARTGKFTTKTTWKRVYGRGFATRKAAKARALALYAEHSPKWAARNGR